MCHLIRCLNCQFQGEAIERPITERFDTGLHTFAQLTCARCGCEEVEPLSALTCLRCKAAEPVDGCDHCEPCLTAIEATLDAKVAQFNARLRAA